MYKLLNDILKSKDWLGHSKSIELLIQGWLQICLGGYPGMAICFVKTQDHICLSWEIQFCENLIPRLIILKSKNG